MNETHGLARGAADFRYPPTLPAIAPILACRLAGVARLAQGLPVTAIPEQILIALVRNDMVNLGSWHHQGTLLTMSA
jgi:hypothetical protein